MITVQEFFDDGEDVLGCNPNITFLHIVLFFSFHLMFTSSPYTIKMPAVLRLTFCLYLMSFFLSYASTTVNSKSDLSSFMVTSMVDPKAGDSLMSISANPSSKWF